MTPEESVVVAAPSVDEAVILGLTRLVATRDEVEIAVLDEGSRGFLGIGARDARVRLTRRPPLVAPAAPQPAPAVAAVAVHKPVVEVEPEPVVVAPPAPEPVTTVEAPVVVSPAVEASVAPPLPAKPEPKLAPAQLQEKKPPRPRVERQESALDRVQIEKTATEVAEHLFAGLNIQYSISWEQEDRPSLWIALRGKDADILVGPKAQTLDSVQYLFRTLLHRLTEGDYNVVLDADGYRKRRQRSLEALARKMADQAVQSGRTVRMKPMPAHERRVIHMILRKDKRVKTESVGKGYDRAITIMPEKKAD
ncbi:MAG TPA: RNA-binding cell elongation regulator Jag/EloR [Anaerolineae bacterium]|nr:RNA-binding cell elongation regulator Jag/EloR [Anaerolineae bacterium]HQI83879.1 RNA-binding cell elongation regulator Jag/EloR [Anaerolineae bacterium]